MAPRGHLEHYRELHEGRAAERVSRVRAQRGGRYRWELGEVLAVEYDKPIPGGLKAYRHDFKSGSRPMLEHDERGKLFVRGGRYTVTTHGIEDTGAGTMATRGITLYGNPGGGVVDDLVAGTKIGVTAGAATLTAGYALRRTNLGPAARGGVGGLTLIALGVGAARFGMPRVAGGLFAAGFVTVTAGVAQEVRARRMLSAKPEAIPQNTQQQSSTNTSTSTTTPAPSTQQPAQVQSGNWPVSGFGQAPARGGSRNVGGLR
jgi:hypothetical protein